MAGETSFLGNTPFDMSNLSDPRTIGLLGMAAGLLQAGGPSATPVNFGQAMGQGIQGGIRGLGMGQHMQLNNAHMGLYGAQGDALRQKADMQKRFSDLIFSGAPQAQGSAPNMTPGQPSGTGADMPPQLPQQAQPTQSQGGDWLKNMTPAQVAAAKAAGMGDFTEEWKLAQSGVPVKAGDYRVVNGKMEYVADPAKGFGLGPDGSVVPIAGAADVNAAYQGAQTLAQERAKASLDLVKVPYGKREILVPRDRAAAYLRNGPGALAPGSGGGGFGESQAPDDVIYSAEAAKTAAEQYKTYQTDGMRAPGLIAKYQQLAKLLEDHNGGKFSDAAMGLASAANSLGFSIDKNLANKQAAEAIQNDLIRNTASTTGSLGAGVSNADVEFSKKANPNLLQSAEGRKAIIDFNVGLEKRKLEISGMARKWQQRFGRIDAVDETGKGFNDYLSQFAERNPLVRQ